MIVKPVPTMTTLLSLVDPVTGLPAKWSLQQGDTLHLFSSARMCARWLETASSQPVPTNILYDPTSRCRTSPRLRRLMQQLNIQAITCLKKDRTITA